jgi:hypothetical protein
MFGLRRLKEIGNWRKLLHEELQNLYFSLNNIRMMKSVRIRWVGNEPYTEETRNS